MRKVECKANNDFFVIPSVVEGSVYSLVQRSLDYARDDRFFVTLLLCLILFFPALAHAEMSLQSNDIRDGQTLSHAQVYNGFGCTGENISPHLSWKNLPEGTKSLALTLYDPDAPTGSGWWHWVAFNIPVDVKNIDSGASLSSMPQGTVESLTDFGSVGFGGACPPKGDKPHRYILTLFALDIEKLDLDETASGAKVGYFLNMHTIEKASITATYGH